MRLNTSQDCSWLPCGGCHLLPVWAEGLQNHYPFNSAVLHASTLLLPCSPAHKFFFKSWNLVGEADHNACTSEFSRLLPHFKTRVRGITGLLSFFFFFSFLHYKYSRAFYSSCSFWMSEKIILSEMHSHWFLLLLFLYHGIEHGYLWKWISGHLSKWSLSLIRAFLRLGESNILGYWIDH